MSPTIYTARHQASVCKAALPTTVQETLKAVLAFSPGVSQTPFVIRKYLPDHGQLEMRIWNTSAKALHRDMFTCEATFAFLRDAAEKAEEQEDAAATVRRQLEIVGAPFGDQDAAAVLKQLGPDLERAPARVHCLVATMWAIVVSVCASERTP